jgi:hypothetical protein
MELNLQSLFGLYCTAALIGSYKRALLVRQDRRLLFVTPSWLKVFLRGVSMREKTYRNKNMSFIGVGAMKIFFTLCKAHLIKKVKNCAFCNLENFFRDHVLRRPDPNRGIHSVSLLQTVTRFRPSYVLITQGAMFIAGVAVVTDYK